MHKIVRFMRSLSNELRKVLQIIIIIFKHFNYEIARKKRKKKGNGEFINEQYF